MGELLEFGKKKSDNTNKKEPTEPVYTYRVVHRRLVNLPSGENELQYVETYVKGTAVGLGPNYIAIANGKGEHGNATCVVTLDMLDSCVCIDSEVNTKKETISEIMQKQTRRTKKPEAIDN